MTCVHYRGAESLFGERVAERDLGRYQGKESTRSGRFLMDALISEDVAGAGVVNIGR